MRDIKFRFWNQQAGIMYKESYNCERSINASFAEVVKRGDLPLQFTGIHDANGKEIYEGDVLQYESPRTIRIIVVKWRFAGWNIPSTSRDYSEIKVIGNIYENPQLVKNNGRN